MTARSDDGPERMGPMIGFELSEDQVAAQKWVRAFAQKEIRPVAPHYDETEEFPWPVLKKAAEIGLYGWDYYQMVAEDETGVLQPALSRSCAGGAPASPWGSWGPACRWSR